MTILCSYSNCWYLLLWQYRCAAGKASGLWKVWVQWSCQRETFEWLAGVLNKFRKVGGQLIRSQKQLWCCYCSRGLEPIGEASASILSPDISFDKTEEDLDTSYLRSGKKWKRSTSIGRPSAPDDEVAAKRSRRAVSACLHLCVLCLVYSVFTMDVESL